MAPGEGSRGQGDGLVVVPLPDSADGLNHPCSASQMKEHLCHAGVEVRSELDSSARGAGCWLRAPCAAVNTRSIHHNHTTSLDPECPGQT